MSKEIKQLQFTEQTINQIALDLQDSFDDDIINLTNDQHRNRVRLFLQSKGYPTIFVDKYMQSVYSKAYEFENLKHKKY